ncbi:MAG: MFS transporter [Kineosporiaceae bacterium]
MKRTWLTHNLRVVSAISLLQDAASELMYPLLPIFLTVTLGAPAAVVGAVEGIAEGAAALTKILAGRLSDRYPRRRLMGLGYALAALGKVVVAVATSWPVVLAGRSVDRLGKGIRGAPRDALLVVDIPADARGRAFGFHRAMDTAGAVVGPLLALAGYELLGHRLRPLLLIAVVPGVASALLVLAVREARTTPPDIDDQPTDDVTPAGAQPGPALPRRYWQVVALVTAFSLVNFPDALILLRLNEIGFSLPGVVLAYAGFNAVYAALSLPAGMIADRLTPRLVFGLGLAVFAIAYTGLGLTRNAVAASALLVCYGAFAALTDGVGKAWISSLLPAERQGSGQGLFQGLSGAAVLAAGLWAGFAWGADGRTPLLISGGLAALIAVGVLLATPLGTSRAR